MEVVGRGDTYCAKNRAVKSHKLCLCNELKLKTLIFKESGIMSIWTYLIASPCYTANTNKQDYTTNI